VLLLAFPSSPSPWPPPDYAHVNDEDATEKLNDSERAGSYALDLAVHQDSTVSRQARKMKAENGKEGDIYT
jgi:hypothetical protein